MKQLTCCLAWLLTISLFAQTEKGASPINSEVKSEQAQQQTYAVVVGISDYQDPEIPDLQYAHRDAEAFASWLHSPAGGSVPTDHIRLLLNEQATAGQFNAAIGWLLEKTQEGDQAVIYFSGHGDMNAKVLNQLGFLLLWDSPARVYLAGALPVDVLKNLVTTLSTEVKAKVLVVADACRAGKLANNNVIGPQLTNANLAKQFANEQKILSCQADEYSIEGEQWGNGRGVFSWHLINGLYGMADGNDDGKITLLEIGHYLQDKVSPEVKPLSQIPLTVGNKTEIVGQVDKDIITDLKEGDELPLVTFSDVEQRGLVQEVLAKMDTSIIRQYQAFKLALKEKRFLSSFNEQPDSNYAEYYYQMLMQESQISPLYSSITRSYAAALQDDAQQVLNGYLKSDLREIGTSNITRRKRYQDFPKNLNRAAELLGEDHYMYKQLLARKLYFEALGYSETIQDQNNEAHVSRIDKYREALRLEPDLPFVYLGISGAYGGKPRLQYDSAVYYANKAIELAPTWIYAYSTIAHILYSDGVDFDLAEHYLDQALSIDSNIWDLRMRRGHFFSTKRQYTKAEYEYKKALQIDSTFLATYGALGRLYFETEKYEESEYYLKKAIKFDSTILAFQVYLCSLYIKIERKDGLEAIASSLIKLGNRNPYVCEVVGMAFCLLGKCDIAEQQFDRSLELTQELFFFPTFSSLVQCHSEKEANEELEALYQRALQSTIGQGQKPISVGIGFRENGQYEKAEKLFRKAIALDPEFPWGYFEMVALYSALEKKEGALIWLEKALTLQKIPFFIYRLYRENAGLDHIRHTEEYKALMKKYFPEEWNE